MIIRKNGGDQVLCVCVLMSISFSVQDERPFAWAVQSCKNIDECSFSAAISTNDENNLTLFDLEINRAQ